MAEADRVAGSERQLRPAGAAVSATAAAVNANCDLKICDLGLARLSQSEDSLKTCYVVTRFQPPHQTFPRLSLSSFCVSRHDSPTRLAGRRAAAAAAAAAVWCGIDNAVRGE